MNLLRYRRSPASMKGLYEWFYRFYGGAAAFLAPILDEVVLRKIASLPGIGTMSAVDYACGSGGLTLRLAPHFRVVSGRDQSLGMLSRARERAQRAGVNIGFSSGNLLAVDEPDDSVDWVFVSFALHLFEPNQVTEIVAALTRIARQGVMVIDHSREWSVLMAVAEWLEGSYYDEFIRMDFSALARQIGVPHFEEATVGRGMVLTFRKDQKSVP